MWKFPYGYVKIEVTCKRPERFINDALAIGVSLHNIKRLSSYAVRTVVRASLFDDVLRLASESGAEIRIIKTGGASIFLRELLSRKALILSLSAAVAVIMLLSKRILVISVNCADRGHSESVLQVLDSEGIARGTASSSIDKSELSRKIAAVDDTIGYASVGIDGAVLRIQTHSSEHNTGDGSPRPASIYASKDCVILSLAAFDGKALVKPGDAVKKDQLLISGDLTPEQGGEAVLTHSEGEIIGEVAYAFSVRIEASDLGPVRSGNTEQSSALELFGSIITPNHGFADYELDYSSLYRFDSSFLPVLIRAGTAHELVLKQSTLSRREMLNKAKARINARILAGVPEDAVIVSKATELTYSDDGALLMRVTVHTYEKIGYTRYL